MPVILELHDAPLGLDPAFEGKDKLLSMLRRYPADVMVAYPIGTAINSSRNDVAACIEPVAVEKPADEGG